ncbi:MULTISPECIES: 3'-5' exonuclease [Oceanobacillus]|uniref:Exonuclease n=1 Tax=Oceanobacillus kimchii TaxID=746691 RepID=A0ABQ5THJ8_9BACI|nr:MULTISPECIES: 3'-5' exonuclease [Oceanobacillus]MBT2599236.1 3'-5' exonuclease [Oceanobacillus sp. ISL-74]MBT2652154.1 3'-5' exonuclease [Oceanobacillus sp. ISL-73]MCT1578564.1 3'-5' exonuclease [Oceanobacillus kimchii]MCT2136387.1 3'-5' exonuclease [Oceanobacillus kimchii]OEH54204.1 hypothetical protein AQ616_10605 [Oceanobacillus sp. E9]
MVKFAAIDFETANEKRNSACSIGVVIMNDTEIIDEFYSLINPLAPFRSRNIYVHGITEEQVQEAPTFAELWPTLSAYLEDTILIAHNASFDMSVLRQSLYKYDMPCPNYMSLCTVKISQLIWPQLENHKLHTVANYHEIPLNHHHAMDDARASAKIFLAALAEQKIGTTEEFIERWLVSKRAKTARKQKATKSTKLYF